MSIKVLISAALFQLTWFGCVLGGARGEWYWGAFGVVALMLFSALQTTLARDMRFVVVLVIAGFCLDSLWATIGVLDYSTNSQPIELSGLRLTLAPAWITLLWAGVGLTLMNSLNFFVSRPWLGALLAGGASIPSYLAGERLGAVIVPQAHWLGCIVVAWLVVFYLMFSWARRIAQKDLATDAQTNTAKALVDDRV